MLGGIGEYISTENVLLAVLAPHQTDQQFGATVQVERFSIEAHNGRMTGTAKQRFRLVERLPANGSLQFLYGKVQILPHDRAQSIPFHTMSCHGSLLKLNPIFRRQYSRQYPAYWGQCTYALYDARVLVHTIQKMLLSSVYSAWFRKPRIDQRSQTKDDDFINANESFKHYVAVASDRPDPTLFAYWVARNLPLDTMQRLELLQMNSTVRLLRREIELLEEVQEDLFCAICGVVIANTREMIRMTTHDALMETFVNPMGHVYQVLTVRDVTRSHVFTSTARSIQDTWFPGYAWSSIHCNSCDHHLGWRFDHVNSEVLPETFFGFRRAALTRSRELHSISSESSVGLLLT
ncbi:uncharacterized protein CCR75_005867 [Bremia lactucae]|uniref:CULT domain-containing protein n=1 Tax=Bremia lactucae TaxID=4779 RepID=A0A976FGB1_BRELC|nr:hypothetical protein CCR75_005867 [Bremia lactucae]